MKNDEYTFSYFYGMESEQFAFYRIPKALFTDEQFKELSSDSKILYGLMLDRMSLSIKNQWLDKEDRVYIIFTLEQVQTMMNCGKDKGVKIMAELDTKKGIGLIERVKQGFGKPDIIYVKSFIHKYKKNQFSEVEKDDFIRSEKADFTRSEKTTSRGRKSRLHEVGKTDFTRSEKPTSPGLENRLHEVGKTEPINTNINYINENDNNHINPHFNISETMSLMDQMKHYEEIVKTNIEFEILKESKIAGREYVDEIVSLLIETICIKRDYITISGVEYPYEIVKAQLLKINRDHIEYVLICLSKNTTKVRNIKSYMLTCIYNAPMTMKMFYTAEVNHDMYGN